jgi:hypothetical protein
VLHFPVLCREAKARTTNSQQGDREFLEAACRFLPACSERQVRMAPEKCECAASGLLAGLAGLPGLPGLQGAGNCVAFGSMQVAGCREFR